MFNQTNKLLGLNLMLFAALCVTIYYTSRDNSEVSWFRTPTWEGLTGSVWSCVRCLCTRQLTRKPASNRRRRELCRKPAVRSSDIENPSWKRLLQLYRIAGWCIQLWKKKKESWVSMWGDLVVWCQQSQISKKYRTWKQKLWEVN